MHIAREAATNVMKHARQTPSIRLAVRSDRECITLHVWNAPSSGRGHETADATGYGLKRMNDRVMLLGGTFEAGGDETGWIVTATLPRF